MLLREILTQSGSGEMKVTFYTLDAQQVSYGSFILITKSLYRSVIDCEAITGFKLIRISFNWALMGSGDKRLLISSQIVTGKQDK